MRSIVDSTDSYEAWMRQQTELSEKLIEQKHRAMSESAFVFLRATFYRWVEQWHAICPNLARRDQDLVLAVGDLHIENFGVWRDCLQRQVWGVNDFDDACQLPFTSDLIRLATSVMLAASEARISAPAHSVCRFLIEGYRTGLVKAKPIVIPATANAALAVLTRKAQEKTKTFWQKALDPESNPKVSHSDLPPGLEDMFRASFRSQVAATFRQRKSPCGLGSLGRCRFTAIATIRKGVYYGREAKALVPSALYWLRQQNHAPSQTATLLLHVIRIPDPYLHVHDRWLIRQFAPDIGKIEMPADPVDRRLTLAPALLRLMGQETANIHLGSLSRANLQKDLKELDRDEGWFADATERMAASTRSDYAAWTEHYAAKTTKATGTARRADLGAFRAGVLPEPQVPSRSYSRSKERRKQPASTTVRRIFLCYRRNDTRSIVGRIYDRLAMDFGKKNIFKDVDNIPYGVDFVKYLDSEVQKCDVLFVVIGLQWLDRGPNHGQIEDPNDFVRIEIASALHRTIPIVPILVDGATMPRTDELPDELKPLAHRHGIEIRHDPDFHVDMTRLLSRLGEGLLVIKHRRQ